LEIFKKFDKIYLIKIMIIKENINLAEYISFKIDCKVKYFIEVEGVEDIIEAIKWAKDKNLPYFILSGGTNVAPLNDFYNGLIIKIKPQDFDLKKNIIKEEDKDVLINVSAFVNLGNLVSKSIQAGLSGLEWAAGIPGLVGGAIFGNAGAYGGEIKDIIISVKSINPENFRIVEHDKSDCEFSYRDSGFKKNKEVILSAILKFKKVNDVKLLLENVKNILIQRASRYQKFPSAGSIFKNLILAEQSDKFKKMIPIEIIKGGKVGVGYLIEKCGLKGYQIGGVMVSNEHGNVIINVGDAKPNDLQKLIAIIKEKVKKQFGIMLEEEIRYI